jgi:lipid-A-disaccharide synthase-like uncharacterized protein
VALRLTGMSVDVARFQARSAFTGAGFTTSESESVVNHPVRRRVIGLLMLLGNVGLVTVMATFIVSFLATENSMDAMSAQLFWLLGAIALLWFIALNSFADRVMCGAIGWLLHRTTSLGQQGPTELLQVTSGYSVTEHAVLSENGLQDSTVSDLHSGQWRFLILGIRHGDGSYSSTPVLSASLVAGDSVVLYGSDEDHRALHSATQ